MTSTPVLPPHTEPRRTANGRPYITPPGGGPEVTYTRVSKWAEALDDRYNLERWKNRMTAIGLSRRPDLLLQVAAHSSESDDDKAKLNETVEAAQDVAGADSGANTGTAIHKFTEYVDRRLELPTMPVESLADLAAYEDATAELQIVAIEQFVVVDELEVAGTFDRVIRYHGVNYIADLKTGGKVVPWGVGGIAIQLACYSRGQLYDPATGTRSPLDVDQDRGILIWLPQGQATCTLWWVDLRLGWEASLIAKRVRAYRTYAKKGLAEQFVPTAPVGTVNIKGGPL